MTADAETLTSWLDDPGKDGLAAVRTKVAEGGPRALEVHFASLPRRVGKNPVAHDRGRTPARRACDVAATALLLGCDAKPETLATLFRQGDAEERRMVLTALPELPEAEGPEVVWMLGEAHRSNDQVLFETGLLDHDLPARALPDVDYRNVVLKVAFLDLPLDRLVGWEARATKDLSAMVLDFMSEREAAGRPVWGHSLLVAAKAPVPGVVDRILGDLWHGSDPRRLVAARAAASLPQDDRVRSTVAERRGRERNDHIRAVLESR